MRIVFIGHLCVDQNVVKGAQRTFYGGGVVHGSITAARLGAQVTVLSKCASTDEPHFRFLSEAGVSLRILPSDRSTSIRNVYPTDNPDDRQSFLLSRADPFAAAELEGLEAEVIEVNALWGGEFPPGLLPALKACAKTTVLDAQGFVRQADLDGKLQHHDWTEKERFLPTLDILKVDHNEARVLTGLASPVEAARRLVELGAATVLLTHKAGLVAATAESLAEAAFGPYPMEGRTGRGDTCTAAFVIARSRSQSLDEAACFAAAVTTRKMQYAGPYRG